MGRPRAERGNVRNQRKVQAAVAAGALPVGGGMAGADVAGGANERVDTGRVVQGGVEEEAGVGESEEESGAAEGGHGKGAAKGVQGGAGPVQEPLSHS